MDYLSYVVKETLRIDSPGTESLLYSAKENITLCGVPIKKGTTLALDIPLPTTIPMSGRNT